MDPDENGSDELEAVPSDMFDSSPVSSGRWAGAAAAGTALFAVRAGIGLVCRRGHLAWFFLSSTPLSN